MARIKETTWHYKYYVFNSQLCAKWCGNYDFYDYPRVNRGPNGKILIGLCPYMRMIFLWGPLAMLTYMVPIAVIWAFVWSIPNSMLGITGVFTTLGTVAASIGLIATVVFIIIGIQKLVEKRQMTVEGYKTRRAEKAKKEPDTDSTWYIIKEYAKAVKTKVCPVLEVE